MGLKIEDKIRNGQEYITTNYDLKEFGYKKSGKANGKIKWRKRSLKNAWKNRVRDRDRKFMEARLGTVYLDDKVLHHDWNSSDCRVVLLGIDEHPNGGMLKTSRRWIEEEEWYE